MAASRIEEWLENQYRAKCSFCFLAQEYLHHQPSKAWDPSHLSLKVAENVINVIALFVFLWVPVAWNES